MYPGISIIVCSYNGRNRILDTLISIINLETTDDLPLELLVIDNCSSDLTAEFVKNYLTNHCQNFPFKIIKETLPGLNFARIAGLSNAKYDWVLFCDDDNVLNKYYLINAQEIIKKYPFLGAIGGLGIAKVDIELPDWFEKYSHSYAVGSQGKTRGILPLGSSLYGAGLLIYKIPLLKLLNNGFKTIMSDRKAHTLSSGGDVEWCFLLQLMGFRIFYANELIFHHKILTERLEWSYYKKLKSGIASGAALLEPYQSLIRNPKFNFIDYLLVYLFKAFYINLVFAFKICKKMIRRNTTTINSLDLETLIIASKALSFRKNIFRSLKHFVIIKNQLNAPV